ncbi:uncharacterized protein LOC129731466 [Wyeomyia smithii]|uniref:uncharacterized protein LOC129731466 n=1 Tax=Wyeomyia smithii TaxID=174621 RepID=UPI0024680E56|nr:uncharacterized protein LOC129731466 [Wyeomyia smithii]
MVQYASLYNDYVPYQLDRPYKDDKRSFLRRWDALNGMKWVPASNGEIPPDAVVAGRDGKQKLFVGRAEVMESVALGSVIPEEKACFVPWGGKNYERKHYEVLCSNGRFVPVESYNILVSGTPAGISEQGEPLYIGRAKYKGSLISGKIQRSYDTFYLPYKKKEVELKISDAEIFIKGSDEHRRSNRLQTLASSSRKFF